MDNYPQTELNVEDAASFLKIPVQQMKELIERKVLVPNWNEYQHLFRFERKSIRIDIGSVLVQKDDGFNLILGFPKIKRAMLLGPAIKFNFSDIKKIAVEEKMNGYNVRVILLDGKLIALTRKGYVCPYSSEKVNDLLDHSFFVENPQLVVYGEMVGPDNPYVPKGIYGIESLELFVFDIRQKDTGVPLPLYERRRLAEKYGFRQVRLFGEFSIQEAPSMIMNIIQEIGRKGHEGVVIKDPNMVLQPIKYTASQSNCSDLQHALKIYNESGRDFIFSRIVREGFQSVEWDENEEDFRKRCLRLGESILRPMKESIVHVREGGRVAEEFTIRVKDRATISKFEEYMRRLGMDIVFSEPKTVGDEYLVHMKKVSKSTSDKTLAMWEGQLWS
ncbi:RNA ligase [Methanomethylovorans sp.]|uniref:RNA ligase n=1 Tax=Methanomethylovorans sp. TaxID=2758717 RepID=UPI000A516D64|nr:RNA ligase [Methanomethylovorans sp.]